LIINLGHSKGTQAITGVECPHPVCAHHWFGNQGPE
jgi:hypothetical protein